MKALQIVLLVVAGAIAGAVVMKMWPRPQPPEERAELTPPAEAPVEKPSPVASQAQEPAAQPPKAEPHPETQPATESPARVPGAPSRAGRPSPGSTRTPVSTPRLAPPTYVAVAPPPPTRPQQRSVSPAPAPRSHQEEASVPAKPAPAIAPAAQPESRQERPAPPLTPPARVEPENATPVSPMPPPSEIHKATLNAGMIIPVCLVEDLSTERNRAGDRFTATLENELIAGEFVIAERGARVEGQVIASNPRGRGLAVALTRLFLSDGQTVTVRTDAYERRADSGMPAYLSAETRVPFRLGVPVTVTERQ